MPIDEYRGGACGEQKEFLQKMGDQLIVACPICSSTHFYRCISAAVLQLKGRA